MAIRSLGGWDDYDDGIRPSLEELEAEEAQREAEEEARWEEARDLDW